MDQETNIHTLKEKIRKFCEDRDWDQFHNAKDLAIALIIENAELLEHFRWKSDKEIKEMFDDKVKKENIEDEMADVLYFLVRIAQKYNIDLSEALERKMAKNEKRYPVDKSRGSNKKYTEL
jgi:NTP pyrophosphatase (non-canonical NTP hydrolase)